MRNDTVYEAGRAGRRFQFDLKRLAGSALLIACSLGVWRFWWAMPSAGLTVLLMIVSAACAASAIGVLFRRGLAVAFIALLIGGAVFALLLLMTSGTH